MTKKSKILIVGSETLIANSLKKYLSIMDFNVVGISNSYEKAIIMLGAQKPDLVLIDMQLSGNNTGIDIAYYIKENLSIPFIYLSSTLSPNLFHAVKITSPAGFIGKPIQEESLFSTIEIVLFNHKNKQ